MEQIYFHFHIHFWSMMSSYYLDNMNLRVIIISKKKKKKIEYENILKYTKPTHSIIINMFQYFYYIKDGLESSRDLKQFSVILKKTGASISCDAYFRSKVWTFN